MGLERGPLSLVSTSEGLLGRKSSGSGLETRDYGSRGSAALTTRHPSLRKKQLALTLPTSGGLSVGIVRSRTKTTECFVCLFVCLCVCVSFFLSFFLSFFVCLFVESQTDEKWLRNVHPCLAENTRIGRGLSPPVTSCLIKHYPFLRVLALRTRKAEEAINLTCNARMFLRRKVRGDQ
jgi:hypothetical protein